jgi:hypothetical protein
MALLAATADGGAEVAGQTVTTTIEFIPGEAGGAQASGDTVTVTTSVVPGGVGGGAGGQVLTIGAKPYVFNLSRGVMMKRVAGNIYIEI